MKNKKLTYKELANYIVSVEDKLNNALNTLGQSLIDFIEFKGEKDNFVTYLKEKYKTAKSEKETR